MPRDAVQRRVRGRVGGQQWRVQRGRQGREVDTEIQFLAEQMIEHYQAKFNAADARRSKTVFTVAGRVGVATPGEKILYLPNGVPVKVTTTTAAAVQVVASIAVRRLADHPSAVSSDVARSFGLSWYAVTSRRLCCSGIPTLGFCRPTSGTESVRPIANSRWRGERPAL